MCLFTPIIATSALEGKKKVEESSEHRASLTIRNGEIRVSEEVSESTGICLSTDDDTITRFILGVDTPYRAHLQNQLHIAPTVNDSVTHLLATLFPKY